MRHRHRAAIVALPSSRRRRRAAKPSHIRAASTQPRPSPAPPLNSLALISHVKCKALVSKTSFYLMTPYQAVNDKFDKLTDESWQIMEW